MISFFSSYESLLELALFNCLLALSQYVVLRAGVFSLASAAFAGIGAYVAAIGITKFGLPAGIGAILALLLGAVIGGIIAVPLARLRGVFQALATLAFVQIVLSVTLNWVDVTQGALGINGIPREVGLVGWLSAVIVVVYVMAAISRSSIGRAFDIIREDETVAVSLGISVQKYHALAFIMSGAIAALAGAMHASSIYAITPNEYGFEMLILVLSMVVLGGRVSVLGPLLGAAVLTVLPEILRGFQDFRTIFQGTILLLSIVFLPDGLADTAMAINRRRRIASLAAQEEATGA